MTFEELGIFLKSRGCHVAMLSSMEFSLKNGIAGCLKALLREFLGNSFDVGASMNLLCIIKLNLSTATVSFTYSFLYVVVKQPADISALASWYREQENYNKPLVLIVNDLERCCGSVLTEFILMLRYVSASFLSVFACIFVTSFVSVRLECFGCSKASANYGGVL